MNILLLIITLILPTALFAEQPTPADNKKVLLAILARNKSHVLPRYLECIQNLDYDKKLISIYINTNNNDDNTEELLEKWAAEHRASYNAIIFETHNVAALAKSNPHEWDSNRFKVLGRIRNQSMQKAKELGCDAYFVVDCDNFITPCTLKELVKKDKPIIAPMLRAIPEEGDPYSNYFFAVSEWGYYAPHDDYYRVLFRQMVGTFKVPVVHCTYLIQTRYIDKLTYVDGSDDYEFVIFSRSARRNEVDQYICNEQEFGVLVHCFTNPTQEEEKRKLEEYFK